MKKVFLAGLVIMILFACNNEKNTRPEKLQRDTMQVLALYKSAQDGLIKYDLMQRVIADTYDFVDVDTVTKQKRWVKDSFYLITYMLPIDSATSKKNNNLPITDSVGKKILYPFPIATNKRYVMSGWNSADSNAINKLKSVR